MLKIGQEEIDAIARTLESEVVFRYHPDGQCDTFERQPPASSVRISAVAARLR